MEIKTLRRIRLLLGVLSITGVCSVLYTVNNASINITATIATITILACITGIIVSCITRWKEIDKGLF